MGRGRALKAGGAEDGAVSGSVKMGRGRALTSAEGAAAENAAREGQQRTLLGSRGEGERGEREIGRGEMEGGRALGGRGAEDGAVSGSVKMGRGRALTSAEGAAA